MIKTLALVLKKQNLGETDRILTILTPDFGKKRVIAKAIRRPLSHLAGHLDTLMIAQIMLTDEDELPKVTGASLVESFEKIRLDYNLTRRALAVLKLVERVILEDVEQRPIFQLTVEAIARINAGRNWEAIWLVLITSIAKTLGLSITNFECLKCGQKISGSAHLITNDQRFVCLNCIGSELGAIPVEANSIKLQQVLMNKSFNEVEKIRIPKIIAQEVEQIILARLTDWFNRPWQSYAQLSDK